MVTGAAVTVLFSALMSVYQSSAAMTPTATCTTCATGGIRCLPAQRMIYSILAVLGRVLAATLFLACICRKRRLNLHSAHSMSLRLLAGVVRRHRWRVCNAIPGAPSGWATAATSGSIPQAIASQLNAHWLFCLMVNSGRSRSRYGNR